MKISTTGRILRPLAGAIVGAALIAGPALPAGASPSFTQITNPDASYQAGTCLIDISALADFTNVTSVDGCGITVSLSAAASKRSVAGSWASWNSPPDAETSTPHLLFFEGLTSATLELSAPVDTLGFELEPNPFSAHDFTADFYTDGGGTLQGSVTRNVDGSAGSLLFAANDVQGGIDEVQISGPVDFAVAQLRVAVATSSGQTVTERRANGTGFAEVTVTRPSGVGSYSVAYTTVNGTAKAAKDYTKKQGTLTMGPGVTTATIEVPILVDGVKEPMEWFDVQFSNPVGGALPNPDAATVWIQD